MVNKTIGLSIGHVGEIEKYNFNHHQMLKFLKRYFSKKTKLLLN